MIARNSDGERASICAIIVAYFPDAVLKKVLAAIRTQAGHVVLVDNGSIGEGREIIDSVQADGTTVIRNLENLGVATALNLGVRFARERGFRWILTLDQDTVCEPDMVECMLRARRADSSPESIGILAPVHFDRETGYVSRELRDLSFPLIESTYVMTSGNLIPIDLFDKVGFYDDGLFIEYVDHDFCLRARKRGFRVVLVRDARMAHRLGDVRQYCIGGVIRFFSHNYRPIRHYYRARNRIVLYRRHFGGWILHDQEFAIKYFVKALLVEERRWAKIVATILGTVDGLFGRMGRADRAANFVG